MDLLLAIIYYKLIMNYFYPFFIFSIIKFKIFYYYIDKVPNNYKAY